MKYYIIFKFNWLERQSQHVTVQRRRISEFESVIIHEYQKAMAYDGIGIMICIGYVMNVKTVYWVVLFCGLYDIDIVIRLIIAI